MIKAKLLRDTLGIAGYLAAGVEPSGQGYLFSDQPAQLDRDRLQSEAPVGIDPVVEWICENLSQDGFTNSESMLVTATKTAVVEGDSPDQSRTTVVPGISDMLGSIRAALSLQITEIAATVGVERPTVYAWLQGKSTPVEQNRNRLMELFLAAKKWRSFSSQPMGKWVRHRNPEGESVLNLLSHPTGSEMHLHTLMRSLAGKVAREKPVKSTARQVADKHGINLSTVPDQSEQVDTLTGRRVSEE